MTEIIKYLIFSGTLITLAVIATIYQMIKKGLFRISVHVEDDPEKEGTGEIEVTGGSNYKDFVKGMMSFVQTGKLKKSTDDFTKRVLEEIPPDAVD